jgi:hypothetical protein
MTSVTVGILASVFQSRRSKEIRWRGKIMYVKINRDVCPAQLAFCERCLGQFLEYPMDYARRCVEELEDDGQDLLTLELHTGSYDVTLKLDEEQRCLMADEGWAYFVDFTVPMYRVVRD